MTIENIINRDNQNYIVLQAEGGQIAMNMGIALAAADGDTEGVKAVVRTTKNLAEINKRAITNTEAQAAIDFIVGQLNLKAESLIKEYNGCYLSSRLEAIETEITAALTV